MNFIDTHHHILPDVYLKALINLGIHSAGGLPFPHWSEASMLSIMDEFAIKTAITSISSPGIYFGEEAFAVDLARKCNDFSANLISKFRNRVGAFGVLPLPNINRSLEEIDYCIQSLQLDGIVLLSNYRGRYLGDAAFTPIFEKLNQHNAVVFIHPTEPKNYEQKCVDLPPSMIEFVCDTTLTIADLLFSGRLEGCPNIKFVLAHAGGTIPYVAGRMSLFEELKPELKEKAPRGTLYYLKQLYYDTTLSTSRSSLTCLLDFVSADHVLFGSDYPFVPQHGVAMECDEFNKYFSDDDKIKTQIAYQTAEVLFPRIKQE